MKDFLLEVKGISKTFTRPVLHNISFNVHKGQSLALVGSNGAGKSTLLKCIMGLIHPQTGAILKEESTKIGFLPELVSFWPEATALDILSLCGKEKIAPEQLKKTLQLVGLADRALTRVGEFSKGMTQRLGLACTLLENPDFLILDEPMTGLDFKAQEWLRHFLKEWHKSGHSLLISTHSLRDVELLANHVLVLDNGKLVKSGSKEEILPDLYNWREQLT